MSNICPREEGDLRRSSGVRCGPGSGDICRLKAILTGEGGRALLGYEEGGSATLLLRGRNSAERAENDPFFLTCLGCSEAAGAVGFFSFSPERQGSPAPLPLCAIDSSSSSKTDLYLISGVPLLDDVLFESDGGIKLSLLALLGELFLSTSPPGATGEGTEERIFPPPPPRRKMRLSGFLKLEKVVVDGAGERVRSAFEGESCPDAGLGALARMDLVGDGGEKMVEAVTRRCRGC